MLYYFPCYLVYAVLLSLFMMGIYYAANTVIYKLNPETHRKEISDYLVLYPLKKYVVEHTPKWFAKIFITCPRCMPTFWVGITHSISILIFLIYTSNWYVLMLLFPVWTLVPICSVLNYGIYKIFKT